MEINSDELQSQTKEASWVSSLLSGVVDLHLQLKSLGQSYFLSFRLFLCESLWLPECQLELCRRTNAMQNMCSFPEAADKTVCLLTCVILNSSSILYN